MKYGILLATFKCTDGTAHCLVQGFHELTLSDGRAMVNDYDCPLLDLSTTIFCTTGNNVQRPVSFVHECSATCLWRRLGHHGGVWSGKLWRTHLSSNMIGTILCIAITSIVHCNTKRFFIMAMTVTITRI